ncbi:MAG: Anaerobic glycerol-3-phosphate dehydrogenase subunit A [Alphaproteobacteria bacterium MarineAlpha5_Bin12]|nr:MAG: Anaerobic glycerol-3-phosphate dehydrogenase subunit A [Alphaproteobacteria bacterium MarineAlpha5_Bin12]
MPRIVVIGGGATGCGVARDLSLRGYKVILIEFGDLGSGTSSRFHGMLQSGARYVVSDTNYAAECYREREIISRIIPEAVELIGGVFVSLKNEEENYSQQFVKCCDKAKIPCEEIASKDLLKNEKELTSDISRVFKVPDAIINPWKLVNALAEEITKLGGEIILNHQVVSIKHKDNFVNSVEIINKNGIKKNILCDGVINASGAWSGKIANLFDQDVSLELTKGSIMVFSHRIVSLAVNRCRMPSSNDIMCPSGTVSLWGTTSQVVDNPNTTKVNPDEIQKLLKGAEELFPKIRDYRSFRAWAGVRPIVKPKNFNKDLPLPRSHSVIDHQKEGLNNILTVCGGSLTTHRSMAEDVVNQIGTKLGINKQCETSEVVISDSVKSNWNSTSYFKKIEKEKNYNDLICECELITKKDIEDVMKNEEIIDFHNIRRRVRVGFGPCQGTFCNSRLANLLVGKKYDFDIEESILNFWAERLKGSISTAYGDQAKQILLSDYIFQENFGLNLNSISTNEDEVRS